MMDQPPSPHQPCEVRAARPDDFEAFVEVYESIAAEGVWIGGELPIDWDRRRPLWERIGTDERLAVMVAVVDGTAVGWLSCEHSPVGRVELGMGVVAAWRGQGIGSALMTEAVAWSRQRGAHKIVLSLWPHNRAARALYEKFGFEVEGRRRRHWRRNNGELWDDLVMGKVLDEAAAGSPYGATEPPTPI